MPTPTISPITLGTVINNSLTLGQRVRYSFDLYFDQTLQVVLDGQTLSDAFLRIYDSNNRLIAFDDDSGGNRDSFIQRSFTQGRYTIEAGAYGDRSAGTYALSLTSLVPSANALTSTIGTNTGLTPTVQSAALTRDNTAQLSGTRAANTTVAIYDGETLLSSSANGGAAWQLQGASWRFLSSALPDGLRTLTARFSGPNNAVSEQSVTLNVDTVAQGSLSPVIVTDAGSNGSILSGSTTTDRTLGLTGTVERGGAVQIYDGSRLLGNALIDGNNWAYTTPALSSGSHTLSARIADLAGNTWTSSSLSASVAELAPRLIGIGQTVRDSLAVKQRLTYSLEVNATQTLSIFLDGQTMADAFLRIYDSNNRLIALDDDSGGNLDSRIQRSFLPGTYSVEAGSFVDRYSGSFALSVNALDSAAPTNTLSNTLGTNAGLTPTIQSGGQTKDNTISLSGTFSSGATVSIYDGQTLLASSTAPGPAWQLTGSTWSYTTTALSDGPHTLQAQFTAPSIPTVSRSVTVNVDTAITGTMSDVITTNTGSTSTIGSGGTTSDSTLALTGTAEAGSLVQIFDGNKLLGTANLTGTNWAYNTPALSLGAHSLSARVIDMAGNSLTTPAKSVTIADSGFSIDLVYTGDTTYQSYFAQAAARWAEVIVGDVPDIDGIDDLRISIAVGDIDGPGGQLGSGNPTSFRPSTLDWGLPYEGEINLDGEDIPAQIANGTFLNLIIHEMGHVLGFGGNFDLVGLLEPNNLFRYVGANALAQYAQLTGTNPTYIPLESTGAQATAGSHWAEDVFGNELMTGYTNGATVEPLSAMTLGVLADLGYTVDYTKASPYSIATSGATTSSISVPENVGSDVFVYIPSDTGQVLSYAILPGDDGNKFSINPTSGFVSFKAAPDFENPGSNLQSNNYTLRLRASYSATTSVDRTVKFNVTDLDEVAPTFTAGSAVSVSVIENRSNTFYTSSATDNVRVTNYGIGGGADAAKFTVNVETGAIRFKVAPDFEAPDSAANNNTYVVVIRAEDGAENFALQTVTVTVTDLVETGFNFATPTATSSVNENLAVASQAYRAQATGAVAATSYSLSGPDAQLFTVSSSGQVFFKSSPNYESPDDAGRDNSYNFTLTAQGPGGVTASQQVTLNVNDVATPTAAQAFGYWQEAELASLGDSTKNIQAYNEFSKEVVQQRDNTSRDGAANQQFASGRQTQWVDRVTGTDIVSDAEFDNGFSMTGKAAAGAQSTIKFRLDKDRTTGADGEGAAVLQLGANDLNRDNITDVTASYDNATGNWTLAFSPGSAALLQAAPNVAGRGVHQLVVDTDGNGAKSSAEASRLFLVASSTASNADTGTSAQNYSVQDRLSKDVFVYYYGDPDGAGVGLATRQDNGDPISGAGDTNFLDKDGDLNDYDYYTTDSARAGLPAATAGNTALHFVTDIAAQTWEFHMAQYDAGNQFPSQKTFVNGNAVAVNHNMMNSNSSRLASLEEAVALYAANFQFSSSSTAAATVGALEPMSNSTANNTFASENNRPNGWGAGANWTAAPTPTGHAAFDLGAGELRDWLNSNTAFVSAVL